MTKNIKLGIIIDGEVYEVIETKYPSCSICDFSTTTFCCKNSNAIDLCTAFDKTHKFRGRFNCIFKKVNTNGEH